MIIYEVWLDGVLSHATGNINHHQDWLNRLHEDGHEPIEKRVKTNGN